MRADAFCREAQPAVKIMEQQEATVKKNWVRVIGNMEQLCPGIARLLSPDVFSVSCREQEDNQRRFTFAVVGC